MNSNSKKALEGFPVIAIKIKECCDAKFNIEECYCNISKKLKNI
jgi:hypothetical protein